MKNVYSNLYAMRAIVCVVHERVSDEHTYNFSFSIFNFQFSIRSGMICFLILQTVCSNWERRLAMWED